MKNTDISQIVMHWKTKNSFQFIGIWISMSMRWTFLGGKEFCNHNYLSFDEMRHFDRRYLWIYFRYTTIFVNIFSNFETLFMEKKRKSNCRLQNRNIAQSMPIIHQHIAKPFIATTSARLCRRSNLASQRNKGSFQ